MITPLEHTGSYYAASANEVTAYPVLNGHQQCDVCVIGAGFTGISTALHLAERGYKVSVIEANRVSWGASGRNGGQLIGGISGEKSIAKALGSDGHEIIRELRWGGHEIIKERVSTYGIDCDLKFGYLDVAIKPRHLRDIEAEHRRLQDEQFPHEIKVLSAEETAGLIGTDAYIGAHFNAGNGHLHPLNLCIGEAAAAVSLGASIYEQSPVLSIERGVRPTVKTAQGSVSADAVVLAGNAYHLVEKELRGIMFPVNSFIVGTQPLDEATVAKINPEDLAVCDPNFVLEYFRLSADKRLLFGGRCNYFGQDPDVIRQHLRPKLARIYPELKDIPLDFAWGGTIGVPVNRVPQLGRLEQNIYFSQGYSGHGVNVTHLAGKIMADAVGGTLERFDLFANIPRTIIPGAHTFSRPMVSLGMLYFRLKDRL